MDWPKFIYVSPYILVNIVCLVVWVLVWRRRTITGSLFNWVISFQLLWTIGFILELLSPTLNSKIFWDNIQWIASLALPLAYLKFIFKFLDVRLVYPKFTWTMLLILPGLFLLFLYTDSLHSIIRPNAWLVQGEQFNALRYDFTTSVYIIAVFNYLISFVILFILVGKYMNSQAPYKRQLGLITLGYILPMITGILPLLNINLTLERDVTPIGFAVGDLFILWGLYKYQFLDLMPLAREKVFESMIDAVVVIDNKDRIIDANSKALALLKKSASEFIGKPVNELYTLWPDLIEKISERKETKSEISIVDKGKKAYFELRFSTLFSARGEESCRVVMIQDVTDHILVEEELRQHRNDLAILVHERTIELERLNRTLESTVSALKQSTTRLNTLLEIDRAILAAESLDELTSSTLGRIRDFIIGCLWASVLIFDYEKRIAHILALSRGEQVELKQMSKLALDDLPDYLINLSANDQVFVSDLLTLENPTKMQQVIMKEGVRAYVYIPLVYQDELIGTLNIGKSEPGPFTEEQDKTLHEIADQLAIAVQQSRLHEKVRQTAEELERRVEDRTQELADKNRELETFAYSVSHDLKSPLRGIDGYSNLLLADHAQYLDNEGKSFLHNIRKATDQMVNLIDDLLEYSLLQRRVINFDQLDISTLIASVIAEKQMEIDARKIKLEVDLQCSRAKGEVDGFLQALRNVLDNALKFTRERQDARIKIGTQELDDTCLVSVSDNGIGFDMCYKDQIFTMFQRLNRKENYPGTGIGLALVNKAMERMGGRVWAESTPGEGATFYLELTLK